MATKSKTKVVTTWPKVEVGTHLTVYTYEDGSTKLVWDDEVLLKEVKDAILKAESVIPAESKPKRKPKKA